MFEAKICQTPNTSLNHKLFNSNLKYDWKLNFHSPIPQNMKKLIYSQVQHINDIKSISNVHIIKKHSNFLDKSMNKKPTSKLISHPYLHSQQIIQKHQRDGKQEKQNVNSNKNHNLTNKPSSIVIAISTQMQHHKQEPNNINGFNAH